MDLFHKTYKTTINDELMGSDSKELFQEIISEVLQIDKNQITDDLAYGELETWDSIAHMEMVGRFEEDLGVSLDIEEITDMENIKIVKQILNEHGVKL